MSTNNPVILSLDAGGTNFVFSALKDGESIVEPITQPAHVDDLDKCIDSIIHGFETIIQSIDTKPVAISFAFPGPANYKLGIIEDTPNIPAFSGSVPLGPILEEHFNIPVYINNDGDLFAYGEAIAGVLPDVNNDLKAANSPRKFNNLIGVTLGTGFGGGLVWSNQLHTGDNSVAAEVWLTGNRLTPNENAEEGIGTRALLRLYSEISNTDTNGLMPKDIFLIAKGEKQGDKSSAIKAFEKFGRNLGEALANLITTYDGLVVIGGGLSGAKELYMPYVLDELNGYYNYPNGEKRKRLIHSVYDYDNPQQRNDFLKSENKTITVRGCKREITYDPEVKTAIIHSRLGASKAIFKGAYYYALNQL